MLAAEPGGGFLRLLQVDAAGTDRDRAHALFVAHYGRLAAWAAVATGDDASGHDIAAEAFARLWGRLTSVTDPRAYLYATAANLIRDDWRRRVRGRSLTDALARQAPARVAAPDGSVRDLVERLPAKQRLVVLLHYYADLPVEQIARSLSLPTGSVKRQLHDARKSLAQALEGRDA